MNGSLLDGFIMRMEMLLKTSVMTEEREQDMG